ncbi:hypothetical protein MMIC_P0582 [Mariprofundus micogutta]|uniref:NolW-like domain-containing protein n=1 Tax=Mariprofundus micogutta TaxID=1921010 RepID=A0A1L8CL53_9PROT|nr:hypothetical protein [Mariprofundus micogutta]GAV19633.1 hypothetical protein MMIC_P0582 [Mariprofundus micogutta]
MIRLLAGCIVWLSLSAPAFAASEIIEVFFLPMQEAADAAKSQLSADGKVAVITSRRILILEDDSSHIKQAKALLKQMDQPVQQFLAQVEIEDIRSDSGTSAKLSSAQLSPALSGGWARIRLNNSGNRSNNRSSFQLRISANEPGSIEVGTLQTLSRETRAWLSGYGLVKMNSVELIPITSGFKVQAWPVGLDQVRVRITPWMQRKTAQVSGQQEMLIDLGTAQNPNRAPSNTANMRYNAVPHVRNNAIVELTGAATELTVPLNETVTIAASQNEANKLGSALLSRHSTIGKRSVVIRVRMTR